MKAKDVMLDGLVRQNPTLKLVLGTCPTLALTTAAMNGVGMGLAVTFVLICSNVIISLLRNVIPSKVRIPAYILIIATFVTIVRMVLYKFLPAIASSMGTYLPLIVVNCLILGRAESFANKNPALVSALDGLAMGLGFMLALTLMGAFREILGAGAIFGAKLWNFKIEFFAQPAGALFTYATFIAVFVGINNAITSARKNKLARLASAPASESALAATTENGEVNAQ